MNHGEERKYCFGMMIGAYNAPMKLLISFDEFINCSFPSFLHLHLCNCFLLLYNLC